VVIIIKVLRPLRQFFLALPLAGLRLSTQLIELLNSLFGQHAAMPEA
jgi:hypothetical protein